VNRAADRLRMATRDLGLAEVAAASGYHEGAAFHAQQCAEKAVKGLLEHFHGSVRGHAITEMLGQLPPSTTPTEDLVRAAKELDRVYLTSRYPNGFVSGSPDEFFDEDSSRTLISQARAILEFCRSNRR
jgi:HEPN domain-containing protein